MPSTRALKRGKASTTKWRRRPTGPFVLIDSLPINPSMHFFKGFGVLPTLPFNPITQIRYDLKNNAHVTINIDLILGHKIKSLLNTRQRSGYKSINWDATNDFGLSVSAGMYVYTVQAGEFRQTKKMLLLK